MKKTTFIAMLFLLFLLIIMPAGNSQAASALKIKIGTASTVSYTGKQVKASLDGTGISLTNTPGLIMKGYAMLPYDSVFKTGLKASVSYSSKTKSITIVQFNHTVKMTLNSKTAYIDGKKATAPIAPVSVYYVSKKITKILVPSRFVAEALGYTYNWSSSTSTVKMKSPYALYYDKTWNIYTGTKGKVFLNEEEKDVSDLPVVIFSNTAFVQARKVFNKAGLGTSYKYDTSKGTVTITCGSNTVLYTLNSTTVYVNDVKTVLSVPPRLIKDNKTKKNFVMVPARFTAESLGLEYQWDSSVKSCNFSKPDVYWSWESTSTSIPDGSAYTNLLLSAVYGRKNDTETFTLTGLDSIQPELVYSESDNEIILIVSNVCNAIEDNSDSIDDAGCLNKIAVTDTGNGVVTFTIELNDNIEYYETITGNDYTITFTGQTVAVEADSIILDKPSDVDFDDITDKDCYYNKQFTLTIPGDYTDYYSNISIPDNFPVTSIKTALNSSGNTVITFTTSKIQGYQISSVGDTIKVSVGDPNEIYKNIIVLDPGHGGTDPGAIGSGFYEKNITYAILYTYAKDLFNSKDSPVKAYWTRTTDTYVTLSDRAAFASSVDADLFVSLHLNSAASTAKGAESYYCTTNNTANSFGVNSKTMADYFQSNLPSKLGISTTRGVKTANFYVLKHNTVPSILIELGFISNSSDMSILGTASGQKKASSSFYDTVCSFFEKYPTGR